MLHKCRKAIMGNNGHYVAKKMSHSEKSTISLKKKKKKKKKRDAIGTSF